LIFWRDRLAADLVLAIAEKITERRLVTTLTSERYNRLFNASFAFCLSAAIPPAIRISSTVIVPLLSADPS
jgi:hypothetical protein